jgi:hypothetical protein
MIDKLAQPAEAGFQQHGGDLRALCRLSSTSRSSSRHHPTHRVGDF